MATAWANRWIAGFTAVVMLLAGVNFVCLNAVAAATPVPDRLPAAHHCCSKAPQASPVRQPSEDRHSPCPRCQAGASLMAAANKAGVPSPAVMPLVGAAEWPAAFHHAEFTGRSSLTPFPVAFPPSMTLLSLSCALTI